MDTSQRKKCTFCSQTADRQCPIAGTGICSTTCLEICLWAEEVLSGQDSIFLEFINKIRSYSELELGLGRDTDIASRCKACEYHWIDTI